MYCIHIYAQSLRITMGKTWTDRCWCLVNPKKRLQNLFSYLKIHTVFHFYQYCAWNDRNLLHSVITKINHLECDIHHGIPCIHTYMWG